MNSFPDTELARVTEATARRVMPLSGRNNKDGADQLAVDAMRAGLEELPWHFRVVLGEGGKDQAPMLYSGEHLGLQKHNLESPVIDLVVDPLECTTNFARGLPDSMSVLLAIEQDHVQLLPGTYMQQMLLPPSAAHLLQDKIDLDTPVAQVLEYTAQALHLRVADLVVVVQNRPRHKELIAQIRALGAGVSLIESGSISAGYELIAGRSQRTHLLWGIFGAPEALILAFMARQAGCGFMARMAPHDDVSARETRELNLEGRILHARDLVHGAGVLVMSGIHGSSWLRGVEALSWSRKHQFRVHSLFWKQERPVLLVHIDGDLVDIQTL
ncbi:MAG: fructose-bisphosphatase class II [Leptospiraceae bacterium]|nr:fructose-bisphosphatase class II [Leptospiraceae bacterium]